MGSERKLTCIERSGLDRIRTGIGLGSSHSFAGCLIAGHRHSDGPM